MSMPKGYIGIDPGAKGYITVLVPDFANSPNHKPMHVDMLPTSAKPMEIANYLQSVSIYCDPVVIMIEEVHALFKSSAKSTFSFGYNVGLINGLSMSTGYSVDKVAPKKWQAKLGVKTRSKTIKKDVAEITERLYPHVNIRGPKGGLIDGMSDSLLIAHYAYLTYKT